MKKVKKRMKSILAYYSSDNRRGGNVLFSPFLYDDKRDKR